MPPRVSVIIPTFNSAEVIGRALASVARQTLANLEVLVVDDGSTDATVDRARDFLQETGLNHAVIQMDANAGPSVARNKGVALAHGEYVAFLDADDEWLPGKLAAQIDIMDRDPSVTLCGCQALSLDPAGQVIERAFEDLPPLLPDGWKTLLWYSFVQTSCALIRRKDLGSQPFDVGLRMGEDRDLWIKLASRGKVAMVQDVLVRIYKLNDSLSRRGRTLIRNSTVPMIEGHMRAFAGRLTITDRVRIRGSLHSQIGKGLCVDPATCLEGSWHLLLAAFLGFRPLHHLLQIAYGAPVLRDIKAMVKTGFSRALRAARPAAPPDPG